MSEPKQQIKGRILIVDDNPAIHADIRKILVRDKTQDAFAEAKNLLFDEESTESDSAEFEIESAYQGQEGLQKVQEAEEAGRPFALAFVDIRMPPGWDGVETIARIWEKYPQLQVVICTAYSDYSWDEMIKRIGKSDSLLILKKPFDNVEVLQMAHALTEKWRLNNELKSRLQNLDLLVNERTAELQLANERFSKAFKASPIPLAIQSLAEEKFVDANRGFEILTGYSRDEFIGRTGAELGIWKDPSEKAAMLRTLKDQASIRDLPCQWRNKAGQLRQILLSAELIDLDGKPFLLTIAQDITRQILLENQLRQAQKMEAVGQLAAGIAHDFNNLLTIVQGHASLLLDGKLEGSSDAKSLQAITATTERAAKLVRQLLAFSRKQVLQRHPVAANEILSSLTDMLPRLLGESIAVKINAPTGTVQINADPGMLDQILVNCAVNARDAMPNGGVLTISANVVEVDASASEKNQDARPGQFMRLTVADTGCGIPPEVLPKIFEPFFTTKPVGKGTGLGLAAVYGIAKQHNGWIEVESQPGKGTSFHIFIPTCAEAPKPSSPPRPKPAVKGGHETILVAEDDEDVRSFVVEVLNSHGYKVLHADCGKAALECWGETTDKIHLLLTDMVMPGGISGRQLAETLLTKDPELCVLYTSGYSPGMAGKDLTLLEGHDFLPKPYEQATLVQRVRNCLDRRRQSAAETAALPS